MGRSRPDDRVVLKAGRSASEQASARNFAGDKLARYKIPKHIVFVEELPYSPVWQGDEGRAAGSSTWIEHTQDAAGWVLCPPAFFNILGAYHRRNQFMSIPTLDGVTARTITTERLTTRVLFTGPEDGHPGAVFARQLDQRDLVGSNHAGPAGRLPGHRAGSARVWRCRPGQEDRCHPRDAATWRKMRIALLDHLGIDRVHVVGNSLGGSVVWRHDDGSP
jgi:hypothetical protein